MVDSSYIHTAVSIGSFQLFANQAKLQNLYRSSGKAFKPNWMAKAQQSSRGWHNDDGVMLLLRYKTDAVVYDLLPHWLVKHGQTSFCVGVVQLLVGKKPLLMAY